MASGPALSNGFRSSSPIITFPGQETGVRNAQTTQGIVLTITMLAVAVFCTRIYVRVYLIKRMRWDDAFMAIAVLASLSLTICLVLQAQWGNILGIPFYSIRALQALFGSNITYIISNVAVKSSILSYCIVAFGHRGGTRVKFTLYSILLFIHLHLVGGLMATLLGCRPFSANWIPGPAAGKCFDILLNAIVNGALFVLEDGLVLLAPIYLVSKISAEIENKKFLFGIFGLGTLAFLAGVIRFIATVVLFNEPLNPNNAIMIPIVVALEINTAIIAASLPTLSPLLNRAFGRARTDSTPQDDYYKTTQGAHERWSPSLPRPLSSHPSVHFPANFIHVNRSVLVESRPINPADDDLPPLPDVVNDEYGRFSDEEVLIQSNNIELMVLSLQQQR